MNLSTSLHQNVTGALPGQTTAFAALAKDVGFDNFKGCLAAFLKLHTKDKAKLATMTKGLGDLKTVSEVELFTNDQGYGHLLQPLYKTPKLQSQRDDKIEFITMVATAKPFAPKTPAPAIEIS